MSTPISRIATDIHFDRRGRQSGYLRVPHSSNDSAYGHIPVPITVVTGSLGIAPPSEEQESIE